MTQTVKMAIALLGFQVLAAGCSEADQAGGAGGGQQTGSASTGPTEHTGSTGSASTGSTEPTGPTGGASSDATSSSSTGSGGAQDPDCRQAGDGKTTLTFINKCDQAIWFAGSRVEGAELSPGQFACRDVGTSEETLSSLRYWGHTKADPGTGKYALAEMTLNTDFNDFDWYNLSHVDASNLPLEIFPVAMPDCRTLSCPMDLLASCPAVGQVKDASGATISCVSPDRDDPGNPVAVYFEAQCKDAYSWSGDDSESMAACAGEDYDIVFCP